MAAGSLWPARLVDLFIQMQYVNLGNSLERMSHHSLMFPWVTNSLNVAQTGQHQSCLTFAWQPHLEVI